MRKLPNLALLASLVLSLNIHSNESAEQLTEHTWKLGEGQPAPATIEQLRWMQGYWVGTGLGGECEENWGAAYGDRMHGYFTLRQNGSATFSEALLMVEENDSVVLKVKHFSPQFEGWEEKDKYLTFKLVKIEAHAAYFNGLTFIREADGALSIYLVMTDKGKSTEHKFDLAIYQQ